MGLLVSKALRPLKSWNIENRAHREISKEKLTPAPKYPSNVEDLKRALDTDPELDTKLSKKDVDLDSRLKDIYVTSHGRPEDDITREKIQTNPNRPLPQGREIVEQFEYGFKEPDKLPFGHVTLKNVLTFLSAHQTNPQQVTTAKIATEYKMREEDVADIIKYFKSYEVYISETKTSKAIFAGPTYLRQQLEQAEGHKELEETKVSYEDSKDKDLKLDKGDFPGKR